MNRWIYCALGVLALSVAQVALVVEARPPGKPKPSPKPIPKPDPTPKPNPKPDLKSTPNPNLNVVKGVNLSEKVTRRVVGNTELMFNKRRTSPTQPSMTTAHRSMAAKLVMNPAVTKPESKALNKVLAGEALSPQERSTLSGLALNDRAGITQAEREVVSRALDDDLERGKVSLSRRFLNLHNDTGQRLTVSVIYQTLDKETKKWQWVPDKPPTDQVVKLTLAPGVTQVAKDGAEPILAFRARVWASNAGKAGWDDWKDQDLFLVPEKDEKGNHRYYANAYDTFTFRFIKK